MNAPQSSVTQSSRSAETADLISRMDALHEATALLVGPSGSGESALSQALFVIQEAFRCRVFLTAETEARVVPDGWLIRSPSARTAMLLETLPVPELESALRRFLMAWEAFERRSVQHDDLLRVQGKIANRLDRYTNLLKTLFDAAPIGVLLADFASGNIIEANRAFLSFGQWEGTALVGQSMDRLVPFAAEPLHQRCVRQYAEDKIIGPIECDMNGGDGAAFPAVIRGFILPQDHMGRQTIWLLIENVSAQKSSLDQARASRDEALRAQLELDTAIEALPYGFVIFDAADRVVVCNDNMRQIFKGMEDLFVRGARHQDILREGVRRKMFPEANGREEEFIAEIAERRRQSRFERFTDIATGRRVRVIEQEIPSGGRIGLRIDVTEEQETSRRLADVIAGSQAGTWEVDLTTGKNVVNDRWSEMIGYRRGELDPVTTDVWKSLIHPDDVERVSELVSEMLNGERDQYDHIYRMRHADGHWVWISDRGRMNARTPAGEPLRMAGVHVDISAVKDAQRQLEEIIQGARVGTWQLDLRKDENQINDLWAEMLGYRREQLEPMTQAKWVALVHPDDQTELEQLAVTLRRKGCDTFESELRLRHRDGHWVWVISRGRVSERAADGTPIILSGVHLDISARKRLEDDLQGERDFLSQLMETSVSGIIAVDEESRIIFCNAEASRQLEVPIDSMIGQICDPAMLNLTDDGRPITIHDMPCRRAMASDSGMVQNVRLRLDLPDGRTKVFSVNAARAPTATHRLRVVATIMDVTNEAQSEARLRAATERAEAANRAKTQFLANMSHELRTPLNGVIGMADLLAADALSAPQAERVDTIRESASLLLSIVNDILDLARVESGRLQLERLPLDLIAIAENVIAMHRPAADSKGLDLFLTVAPDFNPSRLGDPQRMRQVLHNLLGNAIKFTETGAVRLALGQGENGSVALKVHDTGIGMTPEEMQRVFDEFTQADGTITRRFGGTGLGLTIVRRLTHLMGGEIQLDSHKGRGTSITLSLPMDLCSSVAAVVHDGPAAAQPLPPLRLLVAEDNRTNRMILAAMIEKLGHAAIFVTDGEEAVDAWAPGAFDLLLLDISMPRKDGVSALQELQQKAGPRLLPPAIAITANAMTHHVEEYMAAGFAAVVAKPLRLDDLAKALRKGISPVTRAAE